MVAAASPPPVAEKIPALLIANRGEIACRIARACDNLGIRAVAVYTPADAASPHRFAAAAALPVPSYLDSAALLRAAQQAGCAAVHPGCGFLAEDANFAARVRRAGLLFVGPSVAAMRACARKDAARRLAAKAGAPVVPGHDAPAASDAALTRAARALGFPVLVKAAAGGGGRGMRVAWRQEELASALAQARREAKAGFADDAIILEKYVSRARHLEAQIVADQHGNAVVLGERDCSLQRRHQKVAEECPAPNLHANARSRLHNTALALARALRYDNIGTAEFLWDGKQLYFLEINARLQVEHPVTEMVYGVDLVEWQLRLAAGERLPASFGERPPRGAAMQARLCAEDALNNFLPASGSLRVFAPPPAAAGLRVDSGVVAGGVVSQEYDSLMAKIICHAKTREQARQNLARALRQTRVAGVAHNAAFVERLLNLPEFARGEMWTTQIEERQEQWRAQLRRRQDIAAVLCAAALLPCAARPLVGFRVNAPASVALVAGLEDGLLAQVFAASAGGARARLQRGKAAAKEFELEGLQTTALANKSRRVCANIDGEPAVAQVCPEGDGFVVFCAGLTLELRRPPPATAAVAGGDGAVVAPMNAVVASLACKRGAKVKKGETLLTLTAMKMEIAVAANVDGVVAGLFCVAGGRVAAGDVLARVSPAAAAAKT